MKFGFVKVAAAIKAVKVGGCKFNVAQTTGKDFVGVGEGGGSGVFP